jgi:hypothetical protein
VTPLRTPQSRRWPASALVAIAGNPAELKRRLEDHGITVAQSSLVGMIGDRKADHYATALGLHPSMVWPGWDEAALTVMDDKHVNGGGWRHAWLHDQRRKVA